MNKQQEALTLALEFIEKMATHHWTANDVAIVCTSIREALAELPEQQESEAIHAAWMAGYTEGEREAIEKQTAQQEEPSITYRVQMCPRQDCATARKCTSFAACSTRAHIKPEKPTCKDCLHDEQPAQQQEPVANASAWWTLVMGATASIEDALNCMRDEDAKRQAIGAMKYYREKANALYTSPPASKPWVGLTNEDKAEIEKIVGITEDDDGWMVSQMFTLTEAKLREKNA